MRKTKRNCLAKNKRKRTRKVTIGGNGELVDPIVRTLFSRERNIFFFLEFVNLKMKSEKESESNSATGIKEMLNVLSIIIECINSRMTYVQEEELTWRVVNGGGRRRKMKRIQKGGVDYEELMSNKKSWQFEPTSSKVEIAEVFDKETIQLGLSTNDMTTTTNYWDYIYPSVIEQYEADVNQYKKQEEQEVEEEDIEFHDTIELPINKVTERVPPFLLEKMSDIFGQVKNAFSQVRGAMEEIQGLRDDEPIEKDVVGKPEEPKPEEEKKTEELPQAQAVITEVQVVAVPLEEQQLVGVPMQQGEQEQQLVGVPIQQGVEVQREKEQEVQAQEQEETDLEVFIYLVQLTNAYISAKIEKVNKVEVKKQESILSTLGKYAYIILEKLKTISSSIDAKDTTKFSTTEVPLNNNELGDSTLVSQEDKDNFNSFSRLERDVSALTKVYLLDLQSKVEEIEDKSVLARISNKFCEKFHEDLKDYIKSNEGEYRDFIDKLFLQKDSDENKTLMNIREYNYLISENVIAMLLNKEMTETIFKELGIVLDASSLYTLYSMFNGLASDGLINMVSSASQASTLSVLSGQLLKDPKELAKLLLSFTGREATSTILKPEEVNVPVAAADFAAASSPVALASRWFAKSFRNVLNSSAGLLYRNTESINKMIEKYEDSEQVINLAADVSNIISDITYMLVNNKYKADDDIWKLLVSEKTLYKEDVIIQDKLNETYVSIFLDYKKLIVDLNTSICRVRCKETMVPEKFLEDASQNAEYINYLDVTEDEIVMMLKYVSVKFPMIRDTVILLEKVTSKVIEESEKKFNMCDFIKKTINKRLLEAPGQQAPQEQPPQQEKVPEPIKQFESSGDKYKKEEESGYKSPSSYRRGWKFGGSKVIVPREKESAILDYICIIINCDFKDKYGVDTDSITDRTSIILERKTALENLVALQTESAGTDEINGNKLLDDIKSNGYDAFLEEINNEYKSHSLKQSTSSMQLLNNNNFLRVVLNSVADMRIKLCYELLYAYYQTEGFKTYLHGEQNKQVYQEIVQGLQGFFVPIKSTVTSWGWKGLCYFAKGYQYGKEKIAAVVGPLARSSGLDEKIDKTIAFSNKVIADTFSPVSSRLGGRRTRKNKKYKKKSKVRRK
jgi:hypothetical protein